jgi:FtsH-binding integral membrane protein
VAEDVAEDLGRPSSVTRAIRMHWLLVLLGLVVVVLTVVLNDELIRTWAEGRPDLRRVLETQGLEAIKDGAVRPPAFVAPAITLFVVVGLLMWMLLVFFANGNNWARLCLTALLFFTAVTTVAAIRTDPPGVFVVLAVASMVLEVVAVAYLWHPDTNRFLRDTPDP